ncbi:hypothetical protein [Bacillus thuringiensis]|uniref:hypothetical protein n=1 Tax=Bacillus thuringiensis TaxID=1428 RepID=UPI000BF5101C|nr:hypothetical protein [Bacillus thuringiensis]PEY73221.1 hypothetical protein CN355_11305 [Bacillus thuringiensis]
MKLLGLVCMLSVVIYGGYLIGLWQIPILVGMICGILFTSVKRGIGVSCIAVIIGSTFSLLLQTSISSTLAVGKLVGSMLFLPNPISWLALFIPLIVGILLSVCGLWCTYAVKFLIQTLNVKEIIKEVKG